MNNSYEWIVSLNLAFVCVFWRVFHRVILFWGIIRLLLRI